MAKAVKHGLPMKMEAEEAAKQLDEQSLSKKRSGRKLDQLIKEWTEALREGP